MISFHDICMLLSKLNRLAQVKLKHLMPLLFFVKANNKKKVTSFIMLVNLAMQIFPKLQLNYWNLSLCLSSSNNNFKKSPWAPILKFSGPNCQQNDSVFWHSIFKKKKEEHAYLPVFLFNIISLYLQVHHSSIPHTSVPHKQALDNKGLYFFTQGAVRKSLQKIKQNQKR